MTTIIRRRRLGMSSVKGIVRFSETGIKWVREDNGVPRDGMFIRWGWTGNLPANCRDRKVINAAKAIHLVADKLAFRRILEEHGELCPKTWFNLHDCTKGDVDKGVIVRTRYHHQGRGLWFVNNCNDILARCGVVGEGNYYINEFIDKVAEYRVFVMQGRVVCVAKKTPGNPNDVAWNVAKGGRFDNVNWDEWPLKAVRMSLEAFALSNLDFGGVDVMVDANDNCYILEINSAPSLTSPYRQQCFAKGFDWMVENGTETIPLINKKGGHLKFIHPAIHDKAKLVEGKPKRFDERQMEQFEENG